VTPDPPAPDAPTPSEPPAGTVVVLRDHRRVLVRELRPSDGAALAAAFLRLSERSQRLRFGSAPRALGRAALRQLVDSVDGVDHVAFAAVPIDEPGRLVGVARILRYQQDPQTLDIGITVADDFQGVGLGTVLAQWLATHRPRPARRIRTEIAPGNDGVMALLTAFGAVHSRSADGDVIIELGD
jgi:RimJ/RimL family protein N-acetyltransferase